MPPAYAMLAPVFLADLEAAGAARVDGGRVAFVIQRAWCAPGEDRMGYCGAVRLIECVRELHWRRDVAPDYPAVDSITKSLEIEFVRPLSAGAQVIGEYGLAQVGTRSYVLEVVLRAEASLAELARCTMVSVFYDSRTEHSVEPPAELAAKLRRLGGGYGNVVDTAKGGDP